MNKELINEALGILFNEQEANDQEKQYAFQIAEMIIERAGISKVKIHEDQIAAFAMFCVGYEKGANKNQVQLDN